MKNQKELILDYIKEYGSITSLEAVRDLGVMQLSTRIFELKRDGYNILTKMEFGKNRRGEKVNYVRYYLSEDMIENNTEHIPCIE